MVGPYAGRRHAGRGRAGWTPARLVALLALAAAAAGACRSGPHVPTIDDLESVEELKQRFNRDAGQPRIVLLLSPT